MRTVCIVQSRLGSKRFPNKALADIAGRPMIAHVIERAKRIEGLDEVVLAVPGQREIYEKVVDVPVLEYSMNENDVLRRYRYAAEDRRAEVVVRITGDCPLLDPYESSNVLKALLDSPIAVYATNQSADNDGLDTEVVYAHAIQEADVRAMTFYQREHVTPWIRSRYPIVKYRGRTIPGGEKWSVDTPEDLELVRRRYTALPALV